MSLGDLTIMQQFVDAALESWRQSGLMRLFDPAMPVEMRDETRPVVDGETPWKPIPSTVTERDLEELEEQITLRYPALYKEFLRYQHFYELWPEKEITFFPHGIYAWKDRLLDAYFNSWDPTNLIERGYIYFADYSDWGIVCFDTNHQRPGDNDCPIVLIDHELLHDEPLPTNVLYPSFADLMQVLRSAQENPSPSND